MIPVAPPGGDRNSINIDEIEAIAGGPENVITAALDRGFEALDEEFAINLAQNLCPNPCSNPFHDHEQDTPARLRQFVNRTSLIG